MQNAGIFVLHMKDAQWQTFQGHCDGLKGILGMIGAQVVADHLVCELS